MKQFRFSIILVLLCVISMVFSCGKKEKVTSKMAKRVHCTKGIGSHTALEKRVSVEVNNARKDPQLYANYLKERLQYFDDKIYDVPGEVPIKTKEGKQAVEEAIDYLSNLTTKPPLNLVGCLSRSARDHVESQGPIGGTGHVGSDGISFANRLNRYVSEPISGGENISYGSNNARNIVLDLIIDDGVPSRGHRKNMFNESYKSIGVGFGKHSVYKYMCVIIFANEYIVE